MAGQFEEANECAGGPGKARRWTAVVRAMASATGGQAGPMLAGSAPAAAVPGLVAAPPATGPQDNTSFKTRTGLCPMNTAR